MLGCHVALEAMPHRVEFPEFKNRFGVVLGRTLVAHEPSAPPTVVAAADESKLGKALLAARR